MIGNNTTLSQLINNQQATYSPGSVSGATMVPTQRRRSAAEELAEATGEPAETFDAGDEYTMPEPEELEKVPPQDVCDDE